MNMKKIIAMLLALCMIVSVFAACGGNETSTSTSTSTPAESSSASTPADDDEEEKVVDTYTYNSYAEALGTNWNPHTWEMNADNTISSYVLAPLADLTIKDSEAGEYQWIFVAAEDIKDVTAENQADLTKYNVVLPEGKTADQVTDSYVYEIKLRPEMQWEDGTPINADSYIYSMQQMLAPEMKNYRANNYYSGESALAGAYNYFFSDAETVMKTPADLGYDSVQAAIDDGKTVLLNIWSFWGMEGAVDADGNECPEYIDITDTHLYIDPADNSEVSAADVWAAYGPGYLEVGASNHAELAIELENEAFGTTWDAVGLYKVDDYTIRYVCEVAYAYDYFLTSMTSNWLVHEELYEKCKDTSGSLVTSTYNTSAETTLSCYAYRIESMQDEKQIVYVQNENYWEYEKDEDGNLTSTTFFEVDGEFQPQFQTQKIIVDVMTSDAAKLAFLSGKLDDWTPAADEVVEYTTSDQLYQVDETYTMRLFFHTNLDSLKKMDEAGNQNSVVMSNLKFRQAMSQAINRAEFVTATAGYKQAFSMLSSLYFYNVYEDPTSIYRNTDQAKQAIVDLYGVKYGEGELYATLDEAHDSITGYNVTEAKRLFTEACAELVAEGLYTEGEDIVINMGWMAGAMDSSNSQQVTLLNKYMNEALEGTGFGKIELVALDNLSDRYNDVANGTYAIGWGAWGGAAFYPFTMFQVYCDDEYVSYIHEKGCWDPAVETLTMDVNGEEVTMTWKEWSRCMAGTGAYATADFDTKLSILATMEREMLAKYNFIPICTTTACSMLSYKLSYFTEDYNIMYGFGGIRLMSFNYTDAEWAEYVAEQNGEIAY